MSFEAFHIIVNIMVDRYLNEDNEMPEYLKLKLDLHYKSYAT